MVGVFYSAPAEDASPYVKIGDPVRKGDVLCIIEAMKLMNEITAEQDGVIAEVCTDNAQVVDYGHVLFRMKRD
jgi:acetyl-CoA carboxylase biotin carboxyl carrier protein